ncbi:MAG: PAS domain S-box protein [Thermodesulfobacteriota bacterium]|nr:PAS domain S-box protein [Thermodesulfobacteriota bacterium]
MKQVKESPLNNRLARLEKDKQKLKERLAALKKKNRDLENQLRDRSRLLHEVPGAIVLIQHEKIVYANEAAEKLSGYPSEDVLSMRFLDFVHPDKKEQIRIVHRRRLSGKPAPGLFETCLVSKQGKTLFCEVRVEQIRYHGRKAFLVHLIDLRKRKERERRLIQSEKMEALNRMASGVYRPYRDCLDTMKECYDLVLTHPSDRKTLPSNTLKRISKIIEKGDLIVHHLEASADFDKQISMPVNFDLRKVIKEAVETTRPFWEQNRESEGPLVRFRTYLRSELQVRGDPEEIKEALVSIILNAVDALSGDGEIHLSAEENSGFANIYLQDNGIGIQDQIKGKIFDPFFTTKGHSMPGLGLTMASSILARHKGGIHLIERQGRGATFLVKLPMAPQRASSHNNTVKRGIKDSHIMIVGDEDIAGGLLVQLLLSKGAKVATVATLRESLRLLVREKCDVILLVQNESGPQNLKTIPKIRKIDRKIPIILIKGHKDQWKKEDSYTSTGMEPDFVTGIPLNMDRILPLITEALALRIP